MTQAAGTRPQLAHLTAAMDELRAKGTHFKLRILDDQQAPVCHYDGKLVINLASNNYLGLANHPKLIEAALEATRTFGVGSGADSRLIRVRWVRSWARTTSSCRTS